MAKLLMCIVLLLVVVSEQTQATTVDCPDNAIWCEEFDGDTLNPLHWDYDLGGGGWGNSESQIYTKSNAAVAEGELRIHVTKQDGAAEAAGEDNSVSRQVTQPTDVPVTPTYFSSRILTMNRVSFQYVTIEASIKIPQKMDGGIWPAFWLLGTNFPEVGWPFCGEMDIAEWGGIEGYEQNQIQNYVSSASHWADETFGNHTYTTKSLFAERGLHEDFHRYKMEWTPDYFAMFLDNQEIYRKDLVESDPFHEPFFLILNVAVGGSYTGIFEPTAEPGAMSVEWIRAWDNGSGSKVELLCQENGGDGKPCLSSPSDDTDDSGATQGSSIALLVTLVLLGLVAWK